MDYSTKGNSESRILHPSISRKRDKFLEILLAPECTIYPLADSLGRIKFRALFSDIKSKNADQPEVRYYYYFIAIDAFASLNHMSESPTYQNFKVLLGVLGKLSYLKLKY